MHIHRLSLAFFVIAVLTASGRAQDDAAAFRPKAIERLKTLGAEIGYGDVKPPDPEQPQKVETREKPIVRIEMTGGQITDDVMRELRLFPDLETLSLAGTRVTDLGLDYLKGLEKLKVLNLNYSPITDKGLAFFRIARCKDTLEVLQISFTRVTDAGMADVATLPKLKVLAVSHTRIGDQGLAEIAKLKDLNELYLDGTLVTRKGVDSLKDLPLEKLSYVGTRAAMYSDDGFRKKK